MPGRVPELLDVRRRCNVRVELVLYFDGKDGVDGLGGKREAAIAARRGTIGTVQDHPSLRKAPLCLDQMLNELTPGFISMQRFLRAPGASATPEER